MNPSQPDESDGLKRRHLGVLNAAEETPDASTLEDDGTGAPTDPIPPPVLTDRIVQTLRTVYDPEIPLNIYDLGLIYDIDVTTAGDVHVRMTLTAPACPVAGALVREVHDRTRSIPGVHRVKTELVWDPPWTRDRLSMEARLELGLL